MPTSTKTLHAHIKDRELVSIRRAKIGDGSIHGFILDCSKALLLVQTLYDFRLDSFMLLRRRDITEISAGITNRFQRGLLQTEGVLELVDFAFRAPIRSFDDFLASLPPQKIVIVEDEISKPERFLIGTVARVGNGIASIRYFNGCAEICDLPEEISIRRITSCQLCGSYIELYQRHFDRLGRSPIKATRTSKRRTRAK